MRAKAAALTLSAVLGAGLLFGSGIASVSADSNSALSAAAVIAADAADDTDADTAADTGAGIAVNTTIDTDQTDSSGTRQSACAESAAASADNPADDAAADTATGTTTDTAADTTTDTAAVTAADTDTVRAQSAFSGGAGTEESPYLISSADDMDTLAYDINTVGTYYAGCYFELTCNITLNSGWSGIGTAISKSFMGTFDGAGYTIDIGDLTSTASYVGGLFTYAGSSSSEATIKNLTVTGSLTSSSANYIGGIVCRGYCNFENCTSDVDITATKSASTTYYTGGIIASSSSSGITITGCRNTGTIVSAHKYTGGIISTFTGIITNCMNTGDITNTWSYSSTSSSIFPYTGGIAGYGAGTFISCVNTGTLTVETANSNAYVSGIAAFKNATMTACYTAYDLSANDTAHNINETGVTYVPAFALSDIWQLNTQGETVENSLFWGLDTTTYMAVFASDTYPAAVRVLYQLLSGDTEAVYTTVGSTASAPESAPDADFGDFIPDETIVTADITVAEAQSITLTFYLDTDGTQVYLTMETKTGTVFTPPDDPTKENYSFTGWVDADGNLISAGDYLTTDTLYATWIPAYDEETDTYTLSDPDSLTWFIEQVNSGNTSINAVLCADIDASAADWTPLGASDSAPYTGTFDGDGYSVCLQIDSDDAMSYAGFARYLGSEGTIADLTVQGSVTGTAAAAGIACYNYGTITGCVNKASVDSVYYAGGIAAYNYAVIRNCGNEADIRVSNSASQTGAQAGGIAGTLPAATENSRFIQNCYNWGDISAEYLCTTAAYCASAGGIVGEAQSTMSTSYAGYHNYIENCYSMGSLSASGTYSHTGGAVACVVSSSSTQNTTYITDCYYLSGTASAVYDSSTTLHDCASVSNTYEAVFTSADYADLLTYLNAAAADEDEWDTWVADTTYRGRPAFRISIAAYYTITYTGDYEGTERVAEGDTIALSYTDDVHHYYSFTLNTADGEDYAVSTKVYEDLTLYVTKNTYQYTVTYDIGTGDTESSLPAAVTYDSGSTVSVDFDTTPVKAGYLFSGWQDGDGNVYTEDGTTSFTILKDTTLTAQFTPYVFTGSGTQDDPYLIDCAAALQAMAGLITHGEEDYMNAVYYEQTANISLEDLDWSPAGVMGSTLSSSNYLTDSVYDGGGYKITDLSYEGSDSLSSVFAGLNNSTVKDLTVEGEIVTSGRYAAGLVCYLTGDCVIEDCTVEVAITASESTYYAGGIAAYASDAFTITGCTYTGSVSAALYTGGVIAYASGGATLDDVTADADVTASNSSAYASYAGGIAAYFTGSSSSPANMTNCGHRGTVTAYESGSTATGTAAGGLAASTGSGSNYVNIVNSYHGTGAVSSSGYYAGGILGRTYSAYTVISNCYSASKSVTTGYTETYLPGGVIGGIISIYTPTITSTYYNADGAAQEVGYYSSSSNKTDTSGISVIPSAEALTTLLNAWVSENNTEGAYLPWTTDADQNDGYPVFSALLTCKVTYEGAYTGTETVSYGSAVNLPECTEAGYYYEYTVDGETVTAYTVTADVTITVVKKAYTYTATFTDEDGNTVATVTFTVGDTALTVPDVPEKEGYAGIWSDYTLSAADLTITPSYRLIGDVDGDGVIQTKDAVLIERYLAGAYTPDALGLLTADTDGDGAVTDNDAQRIQQYIAGITESFAS